MEKPDASSLPSPKGEVSFNDVKFSYQTKKGDLVLKGINFTVAPGTKTAIVGESGSGKSTCLRLLFRFYDVSEGSITVDGHDLRDLKLDSLRKNIGVVPQDTVLFNASIMYNLLYASPEATEADVYKACTAANIHDRILAFPDGYETKVGERGLKLSGGERQRVGSCLPSSGLTIANTLHRSLLLAPFSRMLASCFLTRPRRRSTHTRSDRSRTPSSASRRDGPPSPLRMPPSVVSLNAC